MKETGIIMLGNHPKLILDGTKTMTRRVLTRQPSEVYYAPQNGWSGLSQDMWVFAKPNQGTEPFIIKCPYGQVGDRLWVRETWAYINNYDIDGSENYYEYKADKPNDLYPGNWPPAEAKGNDEAPKWRSSRFMPKKASRITLEITEVRVERVQEISETDVEREGTPMVTPRPSGVDRNDFRELWDSLNAKRGYGWEVNPFCWVLTFKRI